MSNPSFDLDNILNDIISKNVGEDIKAKVDEIDKETAESKAISDENDNISDAPVVEQGEKAQEGEPEKAEIKAEPETKSTNASQTEEIKNEVKDSVKEEFFAKATEENAPQSRAESVATSQENIYKAPENYDNIIINDENGTQSDNQQSQGETDLFALGGYDDKKAKKAVKKARKKANKKRWRKSGKGKIFISIILILVIAICGTIGYGAFYVNNLLDEIITDDPEADEFTNDWTGMQDGTENFATIYESANVYSYRDMVRQWYYNGDPVSSPDVYNVMLIGEDTRGDNILESGTRADSAIIASVNTKTGEIILTSILRDTYVYYEKNIGDESSGRYGKINGAMAYGGVGCYINAVERMFKINIDNYVIVNFSGFETIIDALGGVTINMTNAEIREINNHSSTYGKVTINGEAGDILLNGEQALAYCRIRHIDSDNARADRQKTVLLQLFKQLKSTSTLKMTSVVSSLLPYVKTGLSKSEILSIGQYAISNGWLSYSTVTYTVPKNETDTNGTAITTCKGGTYYGEWIWKVDCPLASQLLQNKIYGKTNVVLASGRPSFSALSDY